MERVTLEAQISKSPLAAQAEQSRFAGLFQDIKAIRRELAVIATCALAGMAGAVLTSQTPDSDRPLPAPAPKVKGPHYRPITDLYELRGDNKEVVAEAGSELDAFGHSTDIVQPDGKTEDAYGSFFHTPWIHVKRPPNLRETIHIQDRNTFSRVYDRHPNNYAFDIYNATDRPVDIVFASYALRAIQLWLNKTNGNQGPDIDIGGHTLAKVRPISDPHIMIMVNKVPAGARSDIFAATEGVTSRTPGELTRSFIKNNRSDQEPFWREAVATEICQSLVDVADERTIADMLLHQKAMQHHAGSFNKPALKNLDLASQESVCNGLGNFVTAIYEREGHGLPQTIVRRVLLPATTFTGDSIGGLSVETEWIDYGLYRPDKAKFLWLAKHITNREYNEVVAARSADSPTADFYRQHDHF